MLFKIKRFLNIINYYAYFKLTLSSDLLNILNEFGDKKYLSQNWCQSYQAEVLMSFFNLIPINFCNQNNDYFCLKAMILLTKVP